MTNIAEIASTLAKLPRRQYSDLIRQVDEQRRRDAEHESFEQFPHKGMSRDSFVNWIANQHFAVDKGIERIFYLPCGAPEDEVRFLEVNGLASLPEAGPVEAVDFMPDIEGVPFNLFVADVTPRQYDLIMAHKLSLPTGWQLDQAREIAIVD